AALAAGGYVGRADADELGAAYRFLRRTEHLLQLNRLSRTHALPEDPAVLRRLGRAMRFNDGPNEPWFPPSVAGIRSDPAADFDEEWRRHARQVRRLHEKLFYRPLLDAVARLPSEAARLTPAEARARLEALGYLDPAGALRHIDALTTGVRRRAAIQRTLLPVLLGWFADAAEPDAGLLAFRQVSEALGESPWYLRLLRDETRTARRMASVLASSRYATGLLLRAPVAVAQGEQARGKPLPTRFAVIAMGRYGGHETGYGSDADVMFVHDPRPGLDSAGDREASEAAQAVAAEMTRLLELPAPDPPLVL